MTPKSKILTNMSEISAYTGGRPGNTIKRWVREENFPAVLIAGRWESNTDLIDNWQRRRLEDRIKTAADQVSK